MSAITVDSDLVHYEVLGRGRAVVLVHGWLGSWRYWIPTMQKLHLKYRVYAVDLFGFGDSAKNPRKYTVEQQVKLLNEFMEQLGLKKVAMVGHGLGAHVMTEFAREHSDKIARLMLINPPLLDPGDLSTRIPPGQQNLLTHKSDAINQAIHNVARPGLQPQNNDGLAATDVTIASVDRRINRSALREAALARGSEIQAQSNAAQLLSSMPKVNPTDNALYRLFQGVDSETLLQKCFKKSDANYEKLTQDVAKQDMNALTSSANGFDAGRLLDILRTIAIPTIVINGKDDPVLPTPSEDLMNYISNEKENVSDADKRSFNVFTLEDARHFPMLESEEFFQLLNKFLEVQDLTKIETKSRWRRRSR